MNPFPSLPEHRRVVKELHQSKSSLVQLVDLSQNSITYHVVVKNRLKLSVPFDQEVSIHSILASESSSFPKLLSYDPEQKLMMLEYCEFGSLIEVIQNKTYAWDVDTAYQFMFQLVEAVRIMHRKRIVHRDIQPYHILLGKQMTPKITGFGKAKFIPGSEEGKEFKEDIFKLGKTLFILLSGESVQEPRPALVPKLLRNFPEAMGVCIQLMIAPNEDNRKSAQEITEMLTSERPEMSFPTLTSKDVEETKRELPILLNMTYNASQKGVSIDTGGTSFNPREISMLEEPQSDTAHWEVRPRTPTVPPTFSVGQITGVIIAKTAEQSFPQVELMAALRKLASMHNQLRGTFKIALKKNSQLCSGPCERRFLSVDLIHLECGEAFCQLCMTQLLTQAISERNKYSNIKCSVCQARFEPLSDSIAELLEEKLKVELTELKLGEEAVHCPNRKCGAWLDIEPSVTPQRRKCPSCGKSFCTYCFGKPHFVKCDRYENSINRKLK